MTTDSTAPGASRGHPPVVYLHIGLMKSGTSYLQEVLRRNEAPLRAAGTLHVPAPIGQAWMAGTLDASDSGGWAEVVRTLHSWNGPTAVASSELLSFADAEQTAAIVASLRPARLEIVVTARDLARVLPSAWQNKIKHGQSWPFSEYVDSVIDEPVRTSGPAKSFWHHHDLVAIVRRWSAVVGAEHVTVVPVPPSGAAPDLLWDRFAEAMAIPGGDYDTQQDKRSNLSLGYTQAELLRQVNRVVRERIDKGAYRQLVLAEFANGVLRPDAERPAVHDRPLLPPDAYDWTIERSRRMVDELRESGIKLVGDWDDLVPPPLTGAEREAAATSVAPNVPEPIVEAVVELLVRLVDADTKLRDSKHQARGTRVLRRLASRVRTS